MNWMRSPFVKYEQGDFLPIVIGSVFLFLSLPGFVALLVDVDPSSLVIAVPLLVLFGIGNIVGLAFIAFGIRLCSCPGSLTYRITHGRVFSR